MHWTKQRSRNGTVNAILPPVTDPFSGQPALKGGDVELAKFDAAWFGFVATALPMEPTADYAALARTQTGWQMELAGTQTPDDWTAFTQELTGLVAADIAIVTDPATGATRIAISQDGIVQALAFFGTSPSAMSRNAAIAAIGTTDTPLSVLSGRPAANRPDPGVTVCACMNVGRNTLLGAIAGGATTVPALGDCTGAGTNCGSCKPELAALIVNAIIPMAAE
jgi:assimilatory nitrate reductase catalytic subunit